MHVVRSGKLIRSKPKSRVGPKKEEGMRIKFLKGVASVHGGFAIGDVADIPEATAEDWCERGIAEKDAGTGEFIRPSQLGSNGEKPKILRERPDKIPKNMFWCDKCHAFHRLTGKRHLKYREQEVKA